MKLKLIRFKKDKKVTLGMVFLNDAFLCFSLERPWMGNQENISCIPDGEYPVSKRQSPKFGPCFAVDGVKGRSDILIHVGNTVEDSHGCILVGNGIDIEANAISYSRDAMGKFHLNLKEDNISITIKTLDLNF